MILGVGLTVGGMSANAEWNKSVGNYWDLADKSATIERKSEYVDKFVQALESEKLEGMNNALFFFTPSNSFDANLEALKSLQSRLKEIEGMDVKSFEYQTAVQQITQQEFAEASDMIRVLEGCWWKLNHYFLWNAFIFLGLILLSGVLIIAGFIVWAESSY